MEVRVLGPVTVESPTSASPLGKRARALLAVLALSDGSEPTTDELVARVWPSPPPDPAGALAGLRAQLGELPELTTDVARFTDLTRRAADAAAGGDLEEADATLGQALALWRGEALEDVRDTPYLQAEAGRLTELRLGVIEDRLDLGLRQGRALELVDRARALVDGNPTRERLWGLLMSALYRSGRGDEAIAVYAEARATLADELGIEPSEALQQLEAGILRSNPADDEVAGPAAQPRRRARIPVLASTTYGRDELVGEVAALLSSPDVRLLTLTGIGGSGKSRVATLTATAVRSAYTDVAYLQVTEASAGPQLAVEISLALGGAATDDLATSLSALAPEQRALVVLDNLEALAEGPEVVRLLLDASAQVTVLVTSRLALRVPGEHELPVAPLEVPGIAADVDAIAESASVQLFVDRATSAEPTFRLAGQEHDVAEVCAMLDGLPLAIELAAVRVKLRGLDRIIDGLRTSLDLLATGSESVPERQRAMTTAIRWSYDRLTPDAQLVCDRLAMFERGFTIEAVEAVCPDVPDVIEALASIVDARLVRQMESRADVRFVVLGTVRAFANERLLARPDLMRGRELLATFLTRRAEDSRAHLYGADGGLAQARFDDDAADIAAAVDWALESGRRSFAVELMLAGVDCWVAAGRQNQALGLVVRVLDHVPHQAPEAAPLLAAAAMLSHQLSDHDQALGHARAALTLAERLGDRSSASTARTFLAAELMFSGELADGLALAAQAAAEAEELDLYPLSAQALGLLAMARAYSGDFEGERRAHEARLAVVRANGDLARTADVLNTLAEIALDDGDGDTARAFAVEALGVAGQRLPTVVRDASITLARAALAQGDLVVAGSRLTAALDQSDRLGQTFAVAQCLRVGGGVAAARGEADTAVRLFAAAQSLSASPGGGDVPPDQDLAAALTEARASLSEQAARTAWTLGSGLPLASARAQLADVLDRVSAGR
jgi:predicted ATPase/DNA-binding SARP family transcriptional activator